ncbi:MAG TPA: hypothetical protein PLZ84_07505, partial [Clostridia bacterium]|nr:hypothetical protein [Clostridia bacterium]
MNQVFIKSGKDIMFALVRKPENAEAPPTVLLLPGLAQSACDIDYFMSAVSGELVRCGCRTIQLDLCGHGDSYGDFCQTDIKRIQTNIKDAVEHILNTYQSRLYIVLRGIMSNIVLNTPHLCGVSGWVCIN